MTRNEFIIAGRAIIPLVSIIMIFIVCPPMLSAPSTALVIGSIATFTTLTIVAACAAVGRMNDALGVAYDNIKGAFFD